ncbi:MAG: alanine racemase [Lachnospiraceae bacterium]|nr:alanine racemase [Lachnospiraceae bacterium]
MEEYKRVTAKIDLDAMAKNMKNIKAMLPSGVKVMGIVKADAYGHGALETAKVILYNGADALGVAIANEGINLRQNNILVPILILGYTPPALLSDVVSNNLIQTIFSFESALKLSEAAKALGKTAKIHIKIDTGMGRIGFLPNEKAYDEIIEISKLPYIEVEGIYTHFSTADEADKEFTNYQDKLFREAVLRLSEKGLDIPVRHGANSAAIMDFDDKFYNFVRPGIILYGLYPSNEVKKEKLPLLPVMSIKTNISYVKEVPAGTPIGYGRKFTTKEKSVIATVPIGYADGFLRGMKNGGRVIVRGQYANVVGNVCMDQFMIDVSNIDGVSAMDEVIIMGSQGGCSITADEIAGILGTINYEVVCMIGKRVPREYIKNKNILKTINYI